MNVTQTLDAKGLACPLPVVRVKKTIDTLASGDILEVLVTDRGALSDIPAWANTVGHKIVDQKEEDDVIVFYIEKA